MNLVWVTQATYEGEYKLRLTFNDGKTGVVDFEQYLDWEIFAPLKDIETFRRFSLDDWTVTWLDGRLDIAPESLYEQLLKEHEEYIKSKRRQFSPP